MKVSGGPIAVHDKRIHDNTIHSINRTGTHLGDKFDHKNKNVLRHVLFNFKIFKDNVEKHRGIGGVGDVFKSKTIYNKARRHSFLVYTHPQTNTCLALHK